MPRCKNCNEKFEPRFSTLEKYCWEPDCKTIEAMRKLETAKTRQRKEWKQKKRQIKDDLMTLSDWYKILERHFNRYIRERDVGKRCISCPKYLVPGDYDAGHHWNKGEYPSVRFDEDNVFGQCRKCNRYFGGRGRESQPEIIRRIGQERYDAVKDRAMRSCRKLVVGEVKELIETYKMKYRHEKHNRGNNENS